MLVQQVNLLVCHGPPDRNTLPVGQRLTRPGGRVYSALGWSIHVVKLRRYRFEKLFDYFRGQNFTAAENVSQLLAGLLRLLLQKSLQQRRNEVGDRNLLFTEHL